MTASISPSVPIILSNRLPVVLTQEADGRWSGRPASGGLVTALGPVLKAHPGTRWIGWPGCDLAPGVAEALAQASASSGYALSPVEIPPADRDLFYLGFCNEVLWPLFHDLQSLCNFNPDYFRCYQRVNRVFAEAAAAQAPPGGQVWIHDYHLMLVADALRQSRPDLSCGFFLHIPFPPPDVFAKLPWRDRILEGILAHRLAGFQTPRDLANFIACCRNFLGARTTAEGVRVRVAWAGHDCLAGAFPIGIDTADFTRRAGTPEVAQKARELRALLLDRQVILGVDRLDYTKGIPHRLRAFRRMLMNHPDLRGKVTFVQVVVPSRADIPAYGRLKTEIEQLVARINGEFTDIGQWVPIHYVYRHMEQGDLLAWYRAAQVALVTPLKDGMNLVAKEYCACSLEEDCSLILSEFAGAADELKEWAILVNPNDEEGVADELARACRMSVADRRRTMAPMRRHLRRHTVFRFADDFLSALAANVPLPADGPAEAPLEEKVRQLAASPHRATLVLDYDGTLVPLRERPELAAPDAQVLDLLAHLSEVFEVHIVSGRPRATLADWLGALPIGLHGEHGLWSRMPGGEWEANAQPPTGWMEVLRPVLEEACRGLAGSFTERKECALAWHYRGVPEAADPAAAAARLAQTALRHPGVGMVEAIHGHKVLEFRVKGIHKGLVVPRVAHPAHPLLAAGDDRTDEDLFKSLPPHAILVKVGNGPTLAPHRVPDVAAFRRLLALSLPPAGTA